MCERLLLVRTDPLANEVKGHHGLVLTWEAATLLIQGIHGLVWLIKS